MLLARRRNFLPVSLRQYDCQFYVLGFNNMFYSHEGELEFETLDAKSKTNCRSTHVAQIWRGDCVVCRKDVQLLLPSPDRGGRIVATLGQSSSLRRINRKPDHRRSCGANGSAPAEQFAVRYTNMSPLENNPLMHVGMVYHAYTYNNVDIFFQTRSKRTTRCG